MVLKQFNNYWAFIICLHNVSMHRAFKDPSWAVCNRSHFTDADLGFSGGEITCFKLQPVNCQTDFEPSWGCCSTSSCSTVYRHTMYVMARVCNYGTANKRCNRFFKRFVFAEMIFSFFQIHHHSSHALCLWFNLLLFTSTFYFINTCVHTCAHTWDLTKGFIESHRSS